MHMLASGLAGMGIAYLRLDRSYRRLATLTCLAILLHAAWNAGAILAVAGGLRIVVAVPQIDFPGVLLGLAGLTLLLLLGSAMAISLILLHLRRLPLVSGIETSPAVDPRANQAVPAPSPAEETRLE